MSVRDDEHFDECGWCERTIFLGDTDSYVEDKKVRFHNACHDAMRKESEDLHAVLRNRGALLRERQS